MIAKWPMGEQFVTTTPPAKRAMLRILALKKNSQELVNFDLIHWLMSGLPWQRTVKEEFFFRPKSYVLYARQLVNF
jgi:hypothetical protein